MRSEVKAAKTIESYIKKTGLFVQGYSKPFDNIYFTGYIFIDGGGDNGPGAKKDVAVFYSKSHPEGIVFVMSNSNEFFSGSEFTQIVMSARPTQHLLY